MLDTKQSWDTLVTRHAPDPATAQRILDNPLYQDISSRFVQSHDYIAVERLYELHSEGNYDLIVVDTPPTRNALDFLLAPERTADFFSSRLLRLLDRARTRAAWPTSLRDRFTMWPIGLSVRSSSKTSPSSSYYSRPCPTALSQRAREVQRLLADRRTTFIVVGTLEAMPVREAEAFMGLLPVKGFHLGGLVLNRVLARLPARCRRWPSGRPSSLPKPGRVAASLCSGRTSGTSTRAWLNGC